MKIDLCKLLGVEEGEEFKIKGYEYTYTYIIKKQFLYMLNEARYSHLEVNDLINKEIIKLPKKKEVTDDELCILRNIDKEYKWIARDKADKDEYDKHGNLNIYFGKPKKSTKSWLPSDIYCEFHGYNHLFQSIKWEDEEPIYIDDYVER